MIAGAPSKNPMNTSNRTIELGIVMDPILKGRNLVKRYGNVTALDHCDFDLMPGEILAVIGDNGAGKSNLLEAIYYLGALKSFRGAKTDDLATGILPAPDNSDDTGPANPLDHLVTAKAAQKRGHLSSGPVHLVHQLGMHMKVAAPRRDFVLKFRKTVLDRHQIVPADCTVAGDIVKGPARLQQSRAIRISLNHASIIRC